MHRSFRLTTGQNPPLKPIRDAERLPWAGACPKPHRKVGDVAQANPATAGLRQPRAALQPARPVPAATERRLAALPLPGILLLAGLATAAAAQGGYHLVGQLALAGSLAGAVVASLSTSRDARGDLRHPKRSLTVAPLPAAAALAAWAIASGALAGDARAALSIVGLLAGVAAVVFVCQRLETHERETLMAGAIGLGAVVALTGWIGVSFRIAPWALESSGLWRAATTLTYANAAAGLMVPLALGALAFVIARPRSGPACAAACLLAVGVVATISRFGILTLALGVGVLGLLTGARAAARAITPVATGAAIALVALLPSIPGSVEPRPALATAGLVAGVAIAVFGHRLMSLGGTARRSRSRAAAIALASTLLVAGVLVGVARLAPDLHQITAARLTLASPARTDSTQAALHLAAARPLTGVGPGQAGLSWLAPDGTRLFSRYAHDEYLQVLTETGAIGAGLLLLLLAGIASAVARGRRWAPSRQLWAGTVAGLVAFALHSGADFLWHIPVIPLTAALLIGMSAAPASPASPAAPASPEAPAVPQQ